MFSHRSFRASKNPVKPALGEPSDGDSCFLTLSQIAFLISCAHNLSPKGSSKEVRGGQGMSVILGTMYCDTYSVSELGSTERYELANQNVYTAKLIKAHT